MKNPHAVALGSIKTEKKSKTARKNGKQGGRPVKDRTRARTFLAVKRGEIKKLPCEVCGNEKVQCHHLDYSDHTKVMWLCSKHHREWHMNNKTPDGIDSTTFVRITPNTHKELKAAANKKGITMGELLEFMIEYMKNN